MLPHIKLHICIRLSIMVIIVTLVPQAFTEMNSYKHTQKIAVPGQLEQTNLNYHECGDIMPMCPHTPSNDNLSILECVQTLNSSQLESIPNKCEHIIWREIQVMLTVNWIKNVLFLNECVKEHDQLQSCLHQSNFWQCIIKRSDSFDSGNKCRIYINRAYALLFPDYDNLKGFLKSCIADIQKFECGRLSLKHTFQSQIETIKCLLKNADARLKDNCKLVVKQQYSDIMLFEVCSRDLEYLCPQELSGTSSAFKCLVKNKNHPSLTSQCNDQIAQRDKEIAKDYHISRSLSRACKDDIKLHNCRRNMSDDKNVRLAQILLCLESVQKNGTKISRDCRIEIDDHRRMLMQDSQFYPDIMSDCATDINKFCAMDANINYDSTDVIHCLMEHARLRRRKDRHITLKCQRSLEKLIRMSDAGEDWRVDPILRRACKPVVDVACRDTEGGEARVMSCLMEHLNNNVMTVNCSRALLLIQYFVARDFKLDPQLYKYCRDDAMRYCHAKLEWDDTEIDSEHGALVLPCLHRVAYSNDEQVHLHSNCFKEVKRVMRQRAISVELIPEVEDVCINDLSEFCYDRVKRGAEMECLQMNLEQLQTPCKAAVSIYTEEEAAHVELNPVIMSVCSEAMRTHCTHILLSGEDKGGMMECLISHKNDADMRQNQKCRAAIEHFQIISLKNYHFTYKFKEACRPYVSRFCSASTTKNEVVACLSEVIRNNTIQGQRHSIPKECRQQVKAQLYQQRESLLLDPKLASACKTEIKTLCSDKTNPGEALECLIINTRRLSSICHHAVFLIKKSELVDSATDYILLTTCKEMIQKFCQQQEPARLLECLKLVKDEPNFDQRCHLVVVNRMIEQNTDFRFNTNLQLHCRKNVEHYCSDIIAKAQPNEELNGKVVQCLKDKFRKNLLEFECSQEILKILQEQAFNYKFNPLLQMFCKNEIKVLCNPDNFSQDNGLVEECLKTAFVQQKIINRDCRVEVATLIVEAKADIHVDPILEESCAVDLLRYCSNVKTGNSRKLKCLQTIQRDNSKEMEKDCRFKLQRRIEMFRNADTVLMQPPENVEQLVQQLVTSPAKTFFMVILITLVGMIFIMGIFLGRFTKKAINIKNK